MTTPASRTDEHGRPEPDFSGEELALLAQFLDYQRATLAWKASGLTDEAARQRTAASSLSLGGLLGHLAWVEDFWFTQVVGEQSAPEPWASMDWAAHPDGDHELVEEQGLSEVRALWEQSCARSRAVLQEQVRAHGAAALDATHPAWGGREQVSLRWVLLHMIEECARHNGHADLLREAVDGQVGE